MTNKSTKRALILSVLSIAVCLTMLIGSTFAWFTDTATTGVNKIQAGTLDVVLEMSEDGVNWEDAEGKTLDFMKAEGAPTDEEILWEPGCTYQLPLIRVRNNGNLALKYEIRITGIDGDVKLNEAIEWTYDYKGKTEYTANGTLLAGNMSQPIAIKGHMKEEAGNEYQGLSIDGISITVFATQDTVEYDSFNNEYDKDAPTLVMIGDTKYDTLADAVAAAENNATIKLAGNFTLPNISNKELTFTVTDDDNIAVINIAKGNNANGSTLTFDGVTVVTPATHNYVGIEHATKVVYKNCTLKGCQDLFAATVEFENCEFINYKDYNVWTYGASNATFKNCTFTTGGKAVLVYIEAAHTANHTFTDCTFNSNGQLATDKAAVEVGESANGNKANYTITLTNCTANGFAKNNSTSALWGNKNKMPADRLKVTVDGVKQVVAEVAEGENLVYIGTKNDDNTYETVVVENAVIDTNAVTILGRNDSANNENDKNGGSDKLFNTVSTMNNVTVVDNEVNGWNGSALYFGTLVFGTATLNNCTMTGNTMNPSSTYYENGNIADLGVFNYSAATINGGEYGKIIAWTHVDLDIDGAKVDEIYASCTKNFNNNSLTIGADSDIGLIKLHDGTQMVAAAKRITLYVEAGAKVGTIDLTGADFDMEHFVVDIDDDATVGQIIVGENTYSSVADFYAAYPALKN